MKKIIFSLLVAALLASCSSDNLYQNPTNGLSTSTAIQTKSNVGMVLTGAYDQTGHYYYMTIGQIALDDMGDDEMLSNVLSAILHTSGTNTHTIIRSMLVSMTDGGVLIVAIFGERLIPLSINAILLLKTQTICPMDVRTIWLRLMA